MPFSSCREAGYTMLELIVVMAVATVLLSMAVPSFKTTSLSSSRAQGSTLLLSALNLARSEAINRGTRVNVCRRAFFTANSFPACDTGTSATWAQGWLVYVDTTSSGNATTPAAATDIIGAFEPIGYVSSDGSKDAFKVKTPGNVGALQFQANGRAAPALSFTICDKGTRLKDSRRVEIALSGYASLREISVADTVSACAS